MMSGLPAILDRLGLTQVAFAEGIDVSEETVSRWINGHKQPSGANLLAALDFLQKRDPAITLDDLRRGAAA